MEISNELLAAYAAGNVSDEERLSVRQYLIENPNEMESLLMMMDEDYELGLDDDNISTYTDCQESLDELLDEVVSAHNCETVNILPIVAQAALCEKDNSCVVRCEAYALRSLGYDVTDEELIAEAQEKGILQPCGVALYNIGKLAGNRELSIGRRYNCTLDDIRNALEKGQAVLAIVDGGELTGDLVSEQLEDIVAEKPDHVVVVNKVDDQQVHTYDPTTGFAGDIYNHSQFLNAWADSSYHLVIIAQENDYEPHPIDLSDITISPELIELQEAIAENAHEVWAFNRKKEGWTYGKKRDDEKKQHPDLIAYNRLPESEKAYDREMALNTIKLVQKLGWEIKRKE